jgi:hypothetical protein
MVGQHDGVGEGDRVHLGVVAVEGRQRPRLVRRRATAARGRCHPLVDDDVEGQPDALQQRSRDQQDASVRPGSPGGAYGAVAGQVPQLRQVEPRAARPERCEYLAGEGTGVQPVGVAGVGIGAAALQPQRGRPVEAVGAHDDGAAPAGGQQLGDRRGQRLGLGELGPVDGDAQRGGARFRRQV